ncbi:MAG TPA: NADH-quinone oxidoreductase subunit J [Ignavibacteria bacterium]|nr:NADH-quinone oxidoreductase subunit J [Ignavibacteria bacterium]HQY51451.1 NADH-quinone oxidoreductase subunit J [Ignavibacteria bacterium]HRA99181.1 NADH-quinone oxidoreductase subunit J [Ignavibacteria bacterium]
MSETVFYILASFILIFSVLTVTSRKILRTAVYLLFVLLGTCGFYFAMEFNFLAAVQLTVYAGGIVVIIIFSIMLTSDLQDKLPAVKFKKIFFSLIAVLFGAAVCITTILSYEFPAMTTKVLDSSMRTIGLRLLGYQENGFVLPFEVISILLLAAMIGSIIIAKKADTEN